MYWDISFVRISFFNILFYLWRLQLFKTLLGLIGGWLSLLFLRAYERSPRTGTRNVKCLTIIVPRPKPTHTTRLR